MTKLGFMGPNLPTRLTVLKCGWGSGPSHTVKRHSIEHIENIESSEEKQKIISLVKSLEAELILY